MKSLWLAGLLLAAILAGCADDVKDLADDFGAPSCDLTPFDPEGIRLTYPTEDPIVDDMELAYDFRTTNVRTCSLPAVGRNVLSPDGVPHKYLGEIDMRGDLDLGAVAVVGSGEPGGVYILDLRDRVAPVVLSFIPMPSAHVTDLKFSDDGAVLYVASQQPTFATALELPPDPTAPYSYVGFTAYSMADPSNPVWLGLVVDLTVGCHMLEPVQVAPTQDAVFCIASNVRSYLIERAGPVLVNLGFVDYIPTKNGLPAPGAPPLAGDPTCALPTGCLLAQGPHDVTVTHESGSFGAGSYAVVSHWGEGVKVLDISNAPLITEVGSWDGTGATHYNGNVHTAMMIHVADHRYILASPEYTSDGTVPGLWVLDADDLGDLKLVAEWYHPGQHTSQGLFLTTHQWQVAPVGPDVSPDDVRVYLTYNHAGVWVLDFGAILEGDDQGAILGYNLARAPLDEATSVPNAKLSTWDVNVVDGVIYGSDRATGLWMFHYAGDEIGDTRLRGFA